LPSSLRLSQKNSLTCEIKIFAALAVAGIGDPGGSPAFQDDRHRRCRLQHLRAGSLGRLFRRRLGLRGRRTFRGFLRCGGFLSARRAGRRLLFGRFFVGITSVIRDVKSRTFEDQTCASTGQALHLAMSPFRQPTKLFRAFAIWFVTHRLECIEVLTALFTRILVSWHQDYGSVCSADNSRKSALNNVQFNLRPIVD
jgi:hypothetical protein